MPFVKKNGVQSPQPLTNARNIFIGRTGELLFFVQNILKPAEPTHNIISISGQRGVGKSILLTRFIDEARSANFKGYCLTAIVDEQQTTPISIMEKYAFLERDGEAVVAIEKALGLELPPILLAPLRWFEQEKPQFYEKYAAPLLAKYT